MLSIHELLQPIPGVNPSGADTRYTDLYSRIREARREDPDLPQGVWKCERKTADWNAVANLCADALVNTTKDLQLACWLTEAWWHRDGFAGAANGLDVIRGLIEQFWDTVYPRAEEEELEFRAASLEWLRSRLDTAVKSASPSSSVEDYRARLEEIDACQEALRKLQASCEVRFGDLAPRFDGLGRALEEASRKEQLLRAAGERNRGFDAASESLLDSIIDEPVMKPEPRLDSLHFTVTAPSAIQPASNVLVTLWAHLESQRAAVMERAYRHNRAWDPAGPVVFSKGPVRVARDVLLTVHLQVYGARVEDPDDTILWDGGIGCANFVVAVPGDPQTRNYSGKGTVYLNGVRVATVHFVLQATGVPTDGCVSTAEAHIRKAFASYASADRDEVVGRLQGIRKAAPHLEIFFDVLTLRSGQDWANEIERLIASSDVFYLFWSINASKSRWVEQEWRTALRTGRRDFIDPVPLQPAEQAPPPPELAGLHFNDWMLAFQRRILT